MNNKKYKNGVVSIFIVVFSILLLLIIALSFTLIMFKERRRSTETDLSQSAYDSALAGVEDAKRGLLKYVQQTCQDPSKSNDCSKILDILNGKDCDAVNFLLKGSVQEKFRGETPIRSTKDPKGNKLNQAYTCVTVRYNTKDYKRDLEVGQSAIIPIKTRKGASSAKISWFTNEDRGDSKGSIKVLSGSKESFPNSIAAGDPPVLVAHYFKYSNDLTKYDLEKNPNGPKYQGKHLENDYSKMIFLRPANNGSGNGHFNSDERVINPDANQKKAAPIKNVKCKLNKPEKGYYCTGEVFFPKVIPSNNWEYFLRIMPLYHKTSIKVEFLNTGDNSLLLGVQPEIDSNGRANNVYRRVRARVELMDGKFITPGNSLHVTDGGACKSFSTTHEIVKDPDNCLD